MTYKTYNEMRNDMFMLYQAERFQDALDLLLKESPRFSDRYHDTLYYAMCLNGRLGKQVEAIRYFREAIEQIGHWYGPQQLLETDDDLKLIWDQSEFQRLRTLSLERYDKARKETKPEREMVMPEKTSGPLPLVIALHGNTGNAATSLDRWRPVVEDGYLLASIRSSQIVAPNSYVWNDFDIAKQELATHYSEIRDEYSIDTKRVVIGGFSMGGGFALWSVINDIIPATGFIGMGPYIAEPDAWYPLIDGKKGSNLRGFILIGDQDTGCLPGAQQIKDKMDKVGLPCEFELREGLGHDVPNDFGDVAKRALKFILE